MTLICCFTSARLISASENYRIVIDPEDHGVEPVRLNMAENREGWMAEHSRKGRTIRFHGKWSLSPLHPKTSHLPNNYNTPCNG